MAPLGDPDGPSIAVLPFTNMSGDPEQEYFADGIVEDIITALSRVSRLFVIARNSSLHLQGQGGRCPPGRARAWRPLCAGGQRAPRRQTAAHHRAADRCAIRRPSVGRPLRRRRCDDVFELQDRITESVVGAIEPTLHQAEIERRKHSRPASLDAYDLLLRAYALRSEFTPESMIAALGCLDQALAIEPNYAPRWRGRLLTREAPFPGMGRRRYRLSLRGRQPRLARGGARAK